MQTALDSTENKVEGLDAGADDYITKPIDFAELKARVKSMLRIKRLQEELEERERELLEANERLRHMSADRRAHGARQPTASRGAARGDVRARAPAERAVRLRHVRSRSLQERERHVRTPGGRRGAQAVRAASCASEVREIDRVGRYGGEEFMLLLPGTVLDAAVTLRRAGAQTGRVTYIHVRRRTSIRRTASFGVSAWPHPRIGELRRA